MLDDVAAFGPDELGTRTTHGCAAVAAGMLLEAAEQGTDAVLKYATADTEARALTRAERYGARGQVARLTTPPEEARKGLEPPPALWCAEALLVDKAHPRGPGPRGGPGPRRNGRGTAGDRSAAANDLEGKDGAKEHGVPCVRAAESARALRHARRDRKRKPLVGGSLRHRPPRTVATLVRRKRSTEGSPWRRVARRGGRRMRGPGKGRVHAAAGRRSWRQCRHRCCRRRRRMRCQRRGRRRCWRRQCWRRCWHRCWRKRWHWRRRMHRQQRRHPQPWRRCWRRCWRQCWSKRQRRHRRWRRRRRWRRVCGRRCWRRRRRRRWRRRRRGHRRRCGGRRCWRRRRRR